MLRGFLDFFRDTLRRQTEGLTGEQLAARLEPSTMTLGGMLKHLAYVEQVVVLGHAPRPGAVGDLGRHRLEGRPGLGPALGRAGHRRGTEGDVRRGRRGGRPRARPGARPRRLDTIAARPRRGQAVSLRWIVVHMVEEYARHCGHADLIRESIDGATDLLPPPPPPRNALLACIVTM
ncbi:mini-circle protein [Nocardioides gansuensis]|uniref:Mini-circle protein n=1 Tax=Nocardioides gansuensis TaxID=2138300 RepID=A0A2T8F7L3_9ACTN|nr:mini-circle protein [Nocardioides gansuensis]